MVLVHLHSHHRHTRTRLINVGAYRCLPDCLRKIGRLSAVPAEQNTRNGQTMCPVADLVVSGSVCRASYSTSSSTSPECSRFPLRLPALEKHVVERSIIGPVPLHLGGVVPQWSLLCRTTNFAPFGVSVRCQESVTPFKQAYVWMV